MSNQLRGACIFGQSGGPTSVINASAYGVIRAALDAECITKVYGAAHGIKGVLEDKLYVMDEEDPKELELLLHTPSSELGSCRYKIADPEKDDSDYKRILEIFKKYNVRYFFYNGGNDSMDTCNKISRYMESVGYECRVMGVPKTIDNDLFGTDHCPGFASAAKYIATSCMEINKDARVYDNGMITVVEIMGRHAGWLAASAALATEFGSGPDLIYLPETDFDLEKFLADIDKVFKANDGKVLVAVSEGIHYADGSFVSEAKTSATDGFGHAQLGGLATLLASIVKERTGAKVRGIELSLLQRCGAHLASATDVNEACGAGKEAVEQAVKGVTGKMVAFKREYVDGKYTCRYELLPLSSVANFEKKVPLEWINEEQNGLKHEFIDYVLPLIQGEPALPRENSLPRYAREELRGRQRFVPVDSLRPGSVIRVLPGETVPVDGVVLSGTVSLSTAALDGAALPAGKQPGAAVPGGAKALTGPFTMTVTAAAFDSAAQQRLRLRAEQLSAVLDRAERYAAAAAGLVLSAGLVTWLLTGQGLLSVSVLAAGAFAVPGTFTLASVPGGGFRRRALLRREIG